DDQLVGLLTERDLVRVIVDGADPAEVRVRQRMRMDVVTVGPGTDAMEARELMGRHALRHLPVVDAGQVVGIIEQTEPRTGLNYRERREVPERGSIPEPVVDFRGPYADGPPAEELHVETPDLSVLGLAEVRRGVVIWWTLVWSVVRALLRRRWAVIRRRDAEGWWDAASEGAVDAFEKLGPAFVKLG